MLFAHVTLATRDVRATVRFLTAACGWREIHRPGNIERPAAWLQIGDLELHLLEVDRFEPSPFEAEFGRHIAFSHPRGDLAALRERLVELGAELIDPIRPTPFERFFFKDPVNGYVFEVLDAEAPRESPGSEP